MLTDYLLGVVSLFFAWQLVRVYRENSQKAVLYWSWAMATFGISFIAGGSQHGFAAFLGAYSSVWRVALATTAAAMLLVLVSTAFSTLKSTPRAAFVWAGAIGFVTYLVFLNSISDLFIYLLYYSFPALLVVLVFSAWRWRKHGDAYGKWIAFAVLVTLAGSVVQMTGIRLHSYFNHNDLFHVIQLAGMALFYRGAALTTDL